MAKWYNCNIDKSLTTRLKQKSDCNYLEQIIREEWGSDVVVSKGKFHRLALLPGIIAETQGKIAGFLTFNITGNQFEIIAIKSIYSSLGVGRLLLKEARKIAKDNNCKRIWVITTNDNKVALRFYERNGYRVKEIYKNAVTKSRKSKPEIPMIGFGGIPITDEIELDILV